MIADIILFFIASLIIFLPTFIANARDHKNACECFWVNVFIGWTIIGWLPLLVWSLVSRSK